MSQPIEIRSKDIRDVGIILLGIVLVLIFTAMVYGAFMGYIDLQKRNTPLETAITRCLEYQSHMVMVDRAIYICDELPLSVEVQP